MEPINRLFEIFNIDRTKNGEVTWFAPLELEINRHIEYIDTAVIDLNGIDIFLGYDWLVKYNLEVNWNIGIIWFNRCLKEYKTRYQDITFTSKIWRLQLMNNLNQG